MRTLVNPDTTQLVARHDQYDAFVIACYGDPGLCAAEEVTRRPAIGRGEPSTLSACQVAPTFSVVTVIDGVVATG